MKYIYCLNCELQVMVNRLYPSKSSADKGALLQLKQLINRVSFGKIPKNNMKATESFIEVVLFAHVTAASEEFISKTYDVHEACQIVSKFVKLTVPTLDENTLTEDAESDSETNSSTEEDAESDRETYSSTEDTECSTDQDTKVDHVFTCAVDLLNLSLLWHGLWDAIRMGDGNRI